MPSVVAGALISAIGLTGVVGTVVTAVLGAGVSMALNSLTTNTAKRSKALSASDRTELVRSAVTPRRVIYGRARVSGPLVFAYTTDNGTQKNYFLHLVIALASHEVSNFGALYINDEAVGFVDGLDGWKVPPVGSRWLGGKTQLNGINGSNPVQWRGHSGTSTQTSDPYLMQSVSVWTAQHRLQGCAYIYLKLCWDQNLWAGGLPNLSMVVDGKKVYDPRSGTYVFTGNPALCIRDYLLSPFGLSCQADEIDEASFIAAANLCDEKVPTAAGYEQERYICNGVFSSDEKPIDVMERLLSSCAGALVYTQGKYRLYPAGLRTPVLSLTDAQLRGPVVVRPLPARKERVNTVRGTFTDPASNWQSTDFEPVTNATYKAQDGGITYTQDLELGFTADAFMAQRLAKLQLERSRRALTVEVPCNLSALDIAVMEPIRVSISQLGWSDKSFIPTEWKLAPEGGVDLVMIEDDASLYAWDGGVNSDTAPPVVLPDIYPEAPLISLSEDGAQLVVTFTALADAFISSTEVQYRVTGSDTWQAAGSGTVVSIPNVQAGVTYEVQARVINTLGVASGWTQASRQIIGNAVPPGDITQLIASLIDSTLYLDWQPPTGSVARYRLRYSPLTSGAIWSSAVDISGTILNTRASVPARLGTYMLKAVDAFGRESANEASYINLTPDARGVNVVATQTESPFFSGTKTNCSVNGSSQLVISSLVAFDAQSGNFDSGSGNFDSAGGGLSPEGVYDFASVVDLGAVYIARVSASVTADVIDLVADVDGATGDFDSREGNFDGTAPSAVDVVVEVATCTGNPAGSPTWSSWSAVSMSDFTGRGFKFRARLVSSNPMATPAVSALSIQLDMPDRVAAQSGLTSATGGDTITFSPAFKATPAISVSPGNMATGDYVVVSAQSRTGFTVQFKNAVGTGVSRSYDWVARGYGREQ